MTIDKEHAEMVKRELLIPKMIAEIVQYTVISLASIIILTSLLLTTIYQPNKVNIVCDHKSVIIQSRIKTRVLTKAADILTDGMSMFGHTTIDLFGINRKSLKIYQSNVNPSLLPLYTMTG